MTVETTKCRIDYLSDGSQEVYDIPFPFINQYEIIVEVYDNAWQYDRTLVNGTDYTISTNDNNYRNGAILTLTNPIEDTFRLRIRRDLILTQEIDYTKDGVFNEETLEEEADIDRMIDQQLACRIHDNEITLDEHENRITINENNIAINQINIAQNTADITQNASDIAFNKNDITLISGKVAENRQLIDENTDDIEDIQEQIADGLGAQTFLELDDTPSDYIGYNEAFVQVFGNTLRFLPKEQVQAFWGAIQGDINTQTDLITKFNQYFPRVNFHDIPTSGIQGLPIKLNTNEKIDSGFLEFQSTHLTGEWTPATGNEYPASSSTSNSGDFFFINGLGTDTNNDPIEYTFTGGDLAGKTTQDGDMLVAIWDNNTFVKWVLVSYRINPATVFPKFYGYTRTVNTPLLIDFDNMFVGETIFAINYNTPEFDYAIIHKIGAEQETGARGIYFAYSTTDKLYFGISDNTVIKWYHIPDNIDDYMLKRIGVNNSFTNPNDIITVFNDSIIGESFVISNSAYMPNNHIFYVTKLTGYQSNGTYGLFLAKDFNNNDIYFGTTGDNTAPVWRKLEDFDNYMLKRIGYNEFYNNPASIDLFDEAVVGESFAIISNTFMPNGNTFYVTKFSGNDSSGDNGLFVAQDYVTKDIYFGYKPNSTQVIWKKFSEATAPTTGEEVIRVNSDSLIHLVAITPEIHNKRYRFIVADDTHLQVKPFNDSATQNAIASLPVGYPIETTGYSEFTLIADYDNQKWDISVGAGLVTPYQLMWLFDFKNALKGYNGKILINSIIGRANIEISSNKFYIENNINPNKVQENNIVLVPKSKLAISNNYNNCKDFMFSVQLQEFAYQKNYEFSFSKYQLKVNISTEKFELTFDGNTHVLADARSARISLIRDFTNKKLYVYIRDGVNILNYVFDDLGDILNDLTTEFITDNEDPNSTTDTHLSIYNPFLITSLYQGDIIGDIDYYTTFRKFWKV